MPSGLFDGIETYSGLYWLQLITKEMKLDKMKNCLTNRRLNDA